MGHGHVHVRTGRQEIHRLTQYVGGVEALGLGDDPSLHVDPRDAVAGQHETRHLDAPDADPRRLLDRFAHARLDLARDRLIEAPDADRLVGEDLEMLIQRVLDPAHGEEIEDQEREDRDVDEAEGEDPLTGGLSDVSDGTSERGGVRIEFVGLGHRSPQDTAPARPSKRGAPAARRPRADSMRR